MIAIFRRSDDSDIKADFACEGEANRPLDLKVNGQSSVSQSREVICSI
jgi:hypothetical protein